jgi:putative tryptophan/tyrosine transport system substrate-binding protein
MRWPYFAVVLAAALALGAETPGHPPARVVIVKTVALPPFDAAASAIEQSLSGFDVQAVSLDPADADAAARVAALEPDVVVPVGSQATSWAADHVQRPIVFSMVLDPVSHKLVESFERPGRMTGAALDVPLDAQFTALREMLGAARVAVLYNPEASGRTVEAARSAARRAGIELVPIEVRDLSQFESALAKVDRSFDALWSVPDSVVLSRRLAQQILLHTIRHQVPLMGLSEQHVKAGALFALVTSHDENGQQAAERVRRVLAGETAGRIPIATPRALEVVFNARTADSVNVTLRPSSTFRVRPIR